MLLQVFEILVQGLFEPTRRLPGETQRTYVQLLATAAAAVDDRSAPASLATACWCSGKREQNKERAAAIVGRKGKQDCFRSALCYRADNTVSCAADL